jgi:copper chaperone CopZ
MRSTIHHCRHVLKWLSVLTIAAVGERLHGEDAGRQTDTTMTFRVEGAECTACYYSVADSVRQLTGVRDIADSSGLGNRVRVTFDPGQVSAHRIAHAVWRALPLHNAPYRAALALRVPGYNRKERADRINAVLAGWKQWLEIDVLDREEGLLLLRFRPLPKTEREKPLAGWRSSQFLRQLNEASSGQSDPPASLADKH